jgi:hypothetical protein
VVLPLLLPCTLLVTTGLAVLAIPMGGGRKSFWNVVLGGIGDYCALVLALNYGYCYGVERSSDMLLLPIFPISSTLCRASPGIDSVRAPGLAHKQGQQSCWTTLSTGARWFGGVVKVHLGP